MKRKKYPARAYRGITSDHNTWGMCCSEEMARLCAEEHYDRYRRDEIKFTVMAGAATVIAVTAIGLLVC